jgi:hypothetical protein
MSFEDQGKLAECYTKSEEEEDDDDDDGGESN